VKDTKEEKNENYKIENPHKIKPLKALIENIFSKSPY
jgi:hypothetical protein